MAEEYSTNGLGNLQQYGPRRVSEKRGGVFASLNNQKKAEWVVDLAEEISGAPTTSNEVITSSLSGLEHVVPAYSIIVSAKAIVEEALSTTGGSAAATASFQVGLEEADGTAVDVDGLIDATDGALTIASNDIADARGTVLVGSNAALVPNVDIGGEDGELVATLVINDITDMTAVAGKIRILVEYIIPAP